MERMRRRMRRMRRMFKSWNAPTRYQPTMKLLSKEERSTRLALTTQMQKKCFQLMKMPMSKPTFQIVIVMRTCKKVGVKKEMRFKKLLIEIANKSNSPRGGTKR